VIEVYPNIYQIEIPLAGNPLKAIYSYVILGDEHKDRTFYIVDTGFNSKECHNALLEGLNTLGLKLENAKLIITHLHSDHSGLAAELNQSGIEILTGTIDGQMINEMTKDVYWSEFEKRAIMMDLGKDGVDFKGHPGHKYCPKSEIEFDALEEGRVIEIGNYTFKVIDIPGHTPGHIALYEEEQKLLISGDHILDPITPNIAFWGFQWNILEVYLNSLEKVKQLNVQMVLPSHRKIITDHKKRINDLKEHHIERLEEVYDIIKDWTSIRDTAVQMHWSLRAKDWSEFPDPQKWFASGEAMSHLEYLYLTDRAERREVKGILEYKARV